MFSAAFHIEHLNRFIRKLIKKNNKNAKVHSKKVAQNIKKIKQKKGFAASPKYCENLT